MAKKKESAKVGVRWKRKKWLPIVAPKLFSFKEIGTTFVEKDSDAIGRTVEATLSQLTGNMRRQGIAIKLNIPRVQNECAQTEILEFMMQPASVKRLARKAVTKLEDSFCCRTSDNILIRIKPLLVTIHKVNSSVKTSIFHKSRKFIVNYISKVTFEQLIQDLVNQKLQKDLKTVLNKIYPLRACNIRQCGLEKKRVQFILEPSKEEEPRESVEGKAEEGASKKQLARKRRKKPEGEENKVAPHEKAKEAKELKADAGSISESETGADIEDESAEETESTDEAEE